MSLRSLYIHKANVQRASAAETVYAGAVRTWATVHTNLAGRLVPLTGREAEIAAQMAATVTHRWFCSPVQEIRIQDRLVFANRTYRVQVVVEPDHMNRFQRVDLEELQDGDAD